MYIWSYLFIDKWSSQDTWQLADPTKLENRGTYIVTTPATNSSSRFYTNKYFKSFTQGFYNLKSYVEPKMDF